jgi:hypothetical protein
LLTIKYSLAAKQCRGSIDTKVINAKRVRFIITVISHRSTLMTVATSSLPCVLIGNDLAGAGKTGTFPPGKSARAAHLCDCRHSYLSTVALASNTPVKRLASIQKRGLLMWSPIWKFFAVAVILLSVSGPTVAEDPARSEPARADLPEPPYLPRVRPPTRSSGYIFAGTVKSVERTAPKRNGVATVLINFHVDQAMRGVRTGQMLAIREWAGL